MEDRKGETGRQTDRETAREKKDKETGTQTGRRRETERETDRQTDREEYRQTVGQVTVSPQTSVGPSPNRSMQNWLRTCKGKHTAERQVDSLDRWIGGQIDK